MGDEGKAVAIEKDSMKPRSESRRDGFNESGAPLINKQVWQTTQNQSILNNESGIYLANFLKNCSLHILRIELRYIPARQLLWLRPPTNELAVQGFERLLTKQEHMADLLTL
ncbi:hypothetical protein K449DRAFT_438079 [Hypoxylon sp. EC38]|nr:hypothetical protein K449DRAFT_438079 [Hypoxylon sp. EC38]